MSPSWRLPAACTGCSMYRFIDLYRTFNVSFSCAILGPQRSVRGAQIDRAKSTSGDLCASDTTCNTGELIVREGDVATKDCRRCWMMAQFGAGYVQALYFSSRESCDKNLGPSLGRFWGGPRHWSGGSFWCQLSPGVRR